MALKGFALGAALALALAAGGPAAAQQAQLGAAERAAIAPLYEAYQQRNWAAAAAALPAAQAGAQSGPARYLVGQMQLVIGQQTRNVQMQAAAIDAMIASGAAPAATLKELLTQQAALALQSSDFRRADQLLTRALELAPNDPEALARLGELKARQGRRDEAVTLYQRGIAAGEAAGQRVPEHVYKRAIALAFEARAAAPALDLARRLIAAYPSNVNWRDVLLAYRDLGQPDAQTDLDIGRLMRAAGGLHGERDYMEFARALSTAGLAAEGKSVLDEGVEKGMLDPREPQTRDLLAQLTRRATAERSGLAGQRTRAQSAADGAAALNVGDLLLGQGQYAEAAAMYRLALQKGGQDPGLVNSRLGIALTLAGQRAEAEAALRAVTGPRQTLAGFWLVRLARMGTPS